MYIECARGHMNLKYMITMAGDLLAYMIATAEISIAS